MRATTLRQRDHSPISLSPPHTTPPTSCRGGRAATRTNTSPIHPYPHGEAHTSSPSHPTTTTAIHEQHPDLTPKQPHHSIISIAPRSSHNWTLVEYRTFETSNVFLLLRHVFIFSITHQHHSTSPNPTKNIKHTPIFFILFTQAADTADLGLIFLSNSNRDHMTKITQSRTARNRSPPARPQAFRDATPPSTARRKAWIRPHCAEQHSITAARDEEVLKKREKMHLRGEERGIYVLE